MTQHQGHESKSGDWQRSPIEGIEQGQATQPPVQERSQRHRNRPNVSVNVNVNVNVNALGSVMTPSRFTS